LRLSNSAPVILAGDAGANAGNGLANAGNGLANAGDALAAAGDGLAGCLQLIGCEPGAGLCIDCAAALLCCSSGDKLDIYLLLKLNLDCQLAKTHDLDLFRKISCNDLYEKAVPQSPEQIALIAKV
jgi:hypothetical protein